MRRRTYHCSRRAVQILALAAFLYFFFATTPGSIEGAPVNAFFRLDPLLGLLSMLASRRAIPAFAWAGVVVLLTLAFGRVWCGWLCPLGTAVELSNGEDFGRLPAKLCALKYALLIAALGMAALGGLSLAVLDPMAIPFRTLALSLLPFLDWALTRLEYLLFQVKVLQEPLEAFERLTRGRIIPYGEATFRVGFAFLLFFAGILVLNRVRPRFWCRYLCPLGALLGVISKLALVRRRVDETCISCGRCERMCPTAAIAGKGAGFASDAAECIMCLECEPLCPAKAISFGLPRPAWPDALYNPSRRGVLASLVGGLAWGLLGKLKPSLDLGFGLPLVRPPGAQGADFLARCVRCGECMKVCPTAGLRPAILEEGLDGFWTPILVPRAGYCDYGCNSCGQVCPTGAIKPLPLEVKQQTILGQAYIDETRCLPWAQNIPCLVCEEVCPVPEKAISIRGGGQERGAEVQLQRPETIPERCIGCGLCEYKCPAVGEAAIRVYPHQVGASP